MRAQVGEVPPKGTGGLDCVRIDWFDLFQMLLVAEVVTRAALLRTESRGAHQREDFPGLDESWRVNQVVNTDGGGQLNIARRMVPASVLIPDPVELA
jgi:succinate dehydrogenase/fumarate reductase flavoprotein subunit